MRAHVISLAWGLVVGAAVIDSGLKFDTRLFAPDFWDPTTLRQFSSDFVMSPTYFLASVMLVMFWAILLNEDDSYDLLDDENSLTLSPLSLLRQSILFMSGRSGRGGRGRGRGGDRGDRGGRGRNGCGGRGGRGRGGRGLVGETQLSLSFFSV